MSMPAPEYLDWVHIAHTPHYYVLYILYILLTLGAHAQRGLQYLVCLSVCVCFPYSGSTRDEKYNEIYHRVKHQICGNIKMDFFFLKIVLFEILPTPRAMFRILSVTYLLTRKALRLIIIPD